MNQNFADLHLHTYFSDGSYSPEEVVARAAGAGLFCIAITDHDSVAALGPAMKAASLQGGLEVLAGIELTAESAGQEIHILGYLLDYTDKDFLKLLEGLGEARVRRVYAICEKLKQKGVALEPRDVFELAARGTVGRLHVARALKAKGFVSSVPEAFSRYIGDKACAYVGKFRMTPKEAMHWILKMKGVPVLAHPYSLDSRVLIPDLVRDGLMGIEVFYAEHTAAQRGEFTRIAREYRLCITGGSDCHGAAKEEIGIGKIKLSYEYVEKLKEAQCVLR